MGLNQFVCVAICSLVCSHDHDLFNSLNGSKLTSLFYSTTSGFWMVEHQLVVVTCMYMYIVVMYMLIRM